MHLITDMEIDNRGRNVQTLGPEHPVDIDGVATLIRRASWTVYRDAIDQVWSAQGYQKVSDGSFVMANPVSITITDRQGKVLEQIQAVRLSSGSSSSSSSSSGSSSSGNAVDPTTVPVWSAGKLTASDSFPQYSYIAWTTNQYTDCCLVVSQRPYKLIPAYGPGTEGTNYDEVDFGYDSLKRRIRSTTGGGTITRQVLDPRGLAISTWIGTNDTGATPSDPTGGGASGNNMVQVSATQYDNGQDGGDGNPTTQTAFVDNSTTRVTVNLFDWRDRNVATDGELDFYLERCFDNLDRYFRIQRRNTTASGNLIARSDSLFDDHSRVYQSRRYAIDPATGAVGNSLVGNVWYDPAGNVVKSLPAGSEAFIKTSIDSLGRVAIQYLGFDLSPESYAQVFTVVGDTILRQAEVTYDQASNPIQRNTRLRYHNATGTGALGNPSSTQPKARVTYAANYPDAIGRTQAIANFGTNGGTTLSRPSTIPLRGDECLVNSTNFDAAGRVFARADPSGRKDSFFHDSRSREIRRRLNCKGLPSASSSGSSSSACPGCDCEASDDANVDVCTQYNSDGNVARVTAVNTRTGDQSTDYDYGTTLSDSGLASTLLLRQVALPDSEDEDDVKKYAYNRQGERIESVDQKGNVHAYDYDLLGRQCQDRITVVADNVDSTIRRIERTYESRGMVQTVTSYDDSVVGQGNVVNDVLLSYNDFSQLTHDYQAHEGLVDTNATPCVQYGFEDGSVNTIRQTQLIYPDGQGLTYGYGASLSIDEAIGRVASIIDNTTEDHLVDYDYLGDSGFVIAESVEPQVRWTLVGTAGGNDPDTGDIYRGLDRFGRIKDNYWYNFAASEDVDRIRYGYGRASTRQWRQDTVATSSGAHFDDLYAHDGLYRLKSTQRGLLTSAKNAIESGTSAFAQCWQLDAVGNWSGFMESSDGTVVNLAQQRVANKANEIAMLVNSPGPSWATPEYDRNGNVASVPLPVAPSTAFTAIYDAWNRLTRISAGETDLVAYAYDGLFRRITSSNVSDGWVSGAYYTSPSNWQLLEERITSGESTITRQYAWGLRYSDDLVARNGTSGRQYLLKDANWNSTAVIDAAGEVQERYAYSAYGTPTFLTPDFENREASLFEWEILFCGYRYSPVTGCLHVRHREMNPILGQWFTRDPAASRRDVNLYQYCASDPVDQVDPSGLQPFDWGPVLRPAAPPRWVSPHRGPFPGPGWGFDDGYDGPRLDDFRPAIGRPQPTPFPDPTPLPTPEDLPPPSPTPSNERGRLTTPEWDDLMRRLYPEDEPLFRLGRPERPIFPRVKFPEDPFCAKPRYRMVPTPDGGSEPTIEPELESDPQPTTPKLKSPLPNRGKKRCFTTCTEYLKECDLPRGQCSVCHDICRANCHTNPKDLNPWPLKDRTGNSCR